MEEVKWRLCHTYKHHSGNRRKNILLRKKYNIPKKEASFPLVKDKKPIEVNNMIPSVAEWSKALESDASAGGESPVRAPVRAATLCPYA